MINKKVCLSKSGVFGKQNVQVIWNLWYNTIIRYELGELEPSIPEITE
jgi:hypothetical protein